MEHTGPARGVERALNSLLRICLGLPADIRSIQKCCKAGPLAALAQEKGLSGHVMRALAGLSSESRWFQELQDRIRAALLRHSAAALKVHRDGLEAADALRSAGLRCIPFKGTFLSERLYRDPLARRPGDVDLILPGGREDAERAVPVLSGLSYRFPFESPLLRDFYHRVYGQIPLVSGGRATIDLHYAPRDDLPPDAYRQVLKRTQTGDACLPRRRQVQGVEKARIEALDLLLLLTAHYWTTGRSEHLGWLLDLAVLVKDPGTFGNGWEGRVESWRMEFPLAAVFCCLEYEFGLLPPGGVGESLGGRLAPGQRRVCERVKEVGVEGLPEGLVRKVHRLGLPWRRRLALLRKYVWPHPGRIMQQDGEGKGAPGILRRLIFAYRRLQAGMRMR